MNKAELVTAVAKKTGLSKKDCEQAVNATFDAITETLVAGEKVQLVGFGAFEVKERGARIGRNPQTKEESRCFLQDRQGSEGRRCQVRVPCDTITAQL